MVERIDAIKWSVFSCSPTAWPRNVCTASLRFGLITSGREGKASLQVVPFQVKQDKPSPLFCFPDKIGIEGGCIAGSSGPGDDEGIHLIKSLGEKHSDPSFCRGGDRVGFFHQLGSRSLTQDCGTRTNVTMAVRPTYRNPIPLAELKHLILSLSPQMGEKDGLVPKLGQDASCIHPLSRGIEVVPLGTVHLSWRKGAEDQRMLKGRVQADNQGSHCKATVRDVCCASSLR